jgi:hypothetical protein
VKTFRTTMVMAAASSLAALVGCASNDGAQPSSGHAGGDSGTTTSGGAEPLPCDVDAVLAAHCRTCHSAPPAYGAPMPLVTYGDLTAPSKSDPQKKVYERIAVRIHDDAQPMPPPPNARLSAAESSVLDTWIAAGAPQTTAATCAGPTADAGGAGADSGVDPQGLPCTPDTFIRPASPYSAPPSAEEYVCYGFDVTTSQKRQIIALSPDIDNKAVVHHLLLYKMPQAVSATPAPCGGAEQGELVTGWAPGVGNMILPPEAGFPEEGTTHYMMQIHYNNVAGTTAQNDSSGYNFCTTDQLRPNDASVLAFGSINFSIPAQGSLALTCDYTFTNPTIHVFDVQAHMHLRGHAMTTLDTTAGYTVVDVPNFDFQQQYLHPVTYEIKTGDVIRNTCVWNNTTGSAIGFGPTTEDEMCFDFVSYWPRITAPGFSWITPSATSTCTSK